MPILETVKISPSVSYAIWQIIEPIDELMAQYVPGTRELAELESIKVEKRKTESLAARLALRHLLTLHHLESCEVYKDEFGKPHLEHNGAEISISHADGFGAAAINLEGPVGIDIEHPRDQIFRISKKFLHPCEIPLVGQDLVKLTKVWCGKEALYKLHGRTQLIFAEQLKIGKSEDSDQIIGEIIEGDIAETFLLSFFERFDTIICVAN